MTTEYFDALTNARLSVWNAIDNHQDTRDLFRRKFRFGSGPALSNQNVPGFGDLDALWIMPTHDTQNTQVNTLVQFTHTLLLTMWTKDWDVGLAERNVLKLARAIHAAKPDGGPPYTAPYAPVVQLGGVRYEPTVIDDATKIQCIKTLLNVNLKVNFSPKA